MLQSIPQPKPISGSSIFEERRYFAAKPIPDQDTLPKVIQPSEEGHVEPDTGRCEYDEKDWCGCAGERSCRNLALGMPDSKNRECKSCDSQGIAADEERIENAKPLSEYGHDWMKCLSVLPERTARQVDVQKDWWYWCHIMRWSSNEDR